MLEVSFIPIMAWLLQFRGSSSPLLREAADVAIELGAEAAILSGDRLTVYGQQPVAAWQAALASTLSSSAELKIELQHDSLPCEADWKAASTTTSFPPILMRPLWIAPVQNSLQPPTWAVPVRLLDAETVFLATTRNRLHASTRMLLELMAGRC